MKLHLPKLLRVAVLAAAYIGTTATTSADNLSLTTGTSTHTIEGNLAVNGTDMVGLIEEGTLYTKFLTSKRTQNLKVTGDMDVTGNAQVAVGGGSSSSLGRLTVAGTLTVGENAYLTATVTNIYDMVINSGTVELHTNGGEAVIDAFGSGNSYYTTSGKQACITNSLIINGGTLTVGVRNGAYVTSGVSTKHATSGFKGSINQTGGTMSVRGDSCLSGKVDINQTGSNKAAMYFTDNLHVGSGLDITQSNDNAELVIGRFTSAGKTSVNVNQEGDGLIQLAQGASFGGASIINVKQSGQGNIIIGGGISNQTATAAGRDTYYDANRPNAYTHTNTTYNIEQTSGTIQLKQQAKAAATIVNAENVSIGGALVMDAGTTLNTKHLAIDGTSGATIANKGILTVGSGTAGAAGVLNVTSGGTLSLILDGTNAAFVTSANTVSGWTMAEGSTLRIGFKDEYLNTLAPTEANGVKTYNFTRGVLVAQDTNGGVDMTGWNFTLAGLNDTHWTWSNAVWSEDAESGNITLAGTLTFNPWSDVDSGNTDDSFKDDDSGLSTGIVIKDKESVTLEGDNQHSLGTQIINSNATLGHENALGTGPVYSSGTSSLTTEDDVEANLNAATGGAAIVVESGTLSMEGQYKVSGTPDNSNGQDEAWFCVDGEEGKDGFHRAALTNAHQVVEIKQGAELDVNALDDVLVTVGGTEYQLYDDGMAGNKLNYDTYHMQTAGHDVSVSRIQTVSGNKTTKVDMAETAGTLTVDTDIEVDAKGGTIKPQSGAAVSGSITGAVIEGAGGIVDADLSGDNTLKGALELSGKGTTAGNLTLDGAELTLGAAGALGSAAVSTQGTSTLKVAGDVEKATLTGTITNTGELTMDGAYDVDGMTEVPLPDSYVDLSDQAGNNGFRHYERFEVAVVSNKDGSGATLTKGQDLAINHGTLSGELDEVSGDAVFEGGVDYSLYQMVDEGHDVSVSSIQTVSGNQTTEVEMGETAGTLTADASIAVNAEGGTVKLQEGQDGPVEVSGSLADTTVESAGGTISADITGTSDVTVTGDTTLSGTNSYSGETLIDGAELKLEAGSSVGTGDVQLANHGTFDMGGNALSNYIKVTGCTLRGAGAYAGDMDIYDTLDLDGAAQADKVTLIGAGAITGDKLTANALEVQTTGDASVAGDLAINDNGTVTLNDGRVLQVGGSLTLGNGVSLVLNGDYAVGTHLLTGTGSLTLGEVILVCDDTTVELEQQGNSLVLVSLFKLDKAAAVSQANWGIATTSRAFVNTVRGQHSNTGCIADGRGTVWAAAFGSYNDLDGADVDVKGAAVGVDAKVGEHSTLGVAFGYADGEVSPTGLSDVDQEGTYVALYGEHGLAKLSPTSCLSMDWVAAYGQTDSEWKEMDWEQDSLQLNTRLNWNKKVTNRLCMNVFGGLEYFATESDRTNGVKTGSIQNLRGEIGVGVRYVAWGIPAIAATTDEKGATLAAAQPGCEKLILHGEVRYMNDMVRSNPVVEMDGLRGSGSNPGRQGMGIEAGATYRISDRWSASANYGFNTMEDSREHRLNVGASYTF